MFINMEEHIHSWQQRGLSEGFHTKEHDVILSRFNDVVFGVVCRYRNQLLGGKLSEGEEYSTGTANEFQLGLQDAPVNFRTLLLSYFKPHGGAAESDDMTNDQHVVYVEISRDSAADILTVRRFLQLIQEHVKPGSIGRPRYVVVSGDQPSYKYFVELWLESWRKAGKDSSQAQCIPALHEWLIPFPGFFHTDKQAMYSICKELLDGLGLRKLAGCAGLSESQVQNFLSHSHARNNRAVLFNLACAFVIHLTDMVVLDDSHVAETVRRIHESGGSKRVTAESNDAPNDAGSAAQPDASVPGLDTGKQTYLGVVYDETTHIVTEEVLDVGKMVKEQIQKRYCNGPNGTHFISSLLFSCLLTTVGFHVLSRTAHTDITHAFWFRHNSILHATNHLKYQELSIFFAFFRGIIPAVVAEELHSKKPGRSFLRLLSFTGRLRDALDKRGWAYMHMDEALEMLIVRHLKSLSLNFLAHLENAASWLMEVSMFRALCRYVTGSSRSFGRRRILDDGGELPGPLGQFDRNACQWRTVARMLHVMRESRFLDTIHRGSEWLCNVFSSPPVRMNISKDQEMLLNITVVYLGPSHVYYP